MVVCFFSRKYTKYVLKYVFMTKVKIVLRKSKLTNGNYPICIRITQTGYTTSYMRLAGLDCNTKQWSKETSRYIRSRVGYKKLNSTLSNIEDDIENITIRLAGKLTIKSFKDSYNKVYSSNVVLAFKQRIEYLNKLKKIGTSNYYTYAMNAFISYAGTDTIFLELDYKFLKGYKQQRLLEGNVKNTVAMYFRALKAVHNEYCKLNDLPPPMVYRLLDIRTENTQHRALNSIELRKLLDYKPVTIYEQRSLDIFFFSLYGRGITIIDMAELKHSNIKDDRLNYVRSKTGKAFSIPVTKEMKVIVNRWKGDKYLFPIIKDTNNSYSEIKNFNRTYNIILKRISNNIGLPKITGYWARHSFATLMRAKGLNIDVVSQLLGHSNTEVTAIYLKSFDDNTLDNLSEIKL